MAADAGESEGKEGKYINSSLTSNLHGNLVAVKCDEELRDLMQQINASKHPVVVNYGASWCHACKQMLPAFCNLSNKMSSPLFVYVDIDACPEETKAIMYTPTFRFYRNGEKVDEFYGGGPQKLQDHAWLQFD
ncbi:hypothetical protein O6H91_01G082100 [Diphasiastrum complanatum]|uniref:Uncharacterized protein n=2 Tax=Diphasiastrum complanatum TaxID=34168 RepID=A0ACC2ESW5_DIPCM|nr:hypothetical protein O6H91_01G081800 [Diphasiastrum complanatum]KAJ7569521.1 hypothetical protein O6H91_01G082100 [Diphasiastrum complanatum]